METAKEIVRTLKVAVLVMFVALVILQTVQTHSAGTGHEIGSDTDPHSYFTTIRG